MFIKKLFLVLLIWENCTAIPNKQRQKKANPDETLLLLEPMKEKLAERILSPDDLKNDKVTEMDANTSSQNYLQTHSICPWKLVQRFNGNRIPNTTIEAVCLNKECRIPCNTDVNAHNRKQLHKEMPTSGCHPIKYFRWVQVLKGKKNKKKRRHVDRLLQITVGCTCGSVTPKKLP